MVTIPNGLFLNKAVSNANSGRLAEQVVVEFALPGNINVGEIKALMKQAALCSPYVFRKKPVTVLVEDRFDYKPLTVFKVKAYVMDVRFERLMASDITERIKEELGLLKKTAGSEPQTM
jgi:small-conductance mechanosensitive channel